MRTNILHFTTSPRALFLCGAIALCTAFFSYIFLLASATFYIAERGHAEERIVRLHSNVNTLELSLNKLKNELSINDAGEFGLMGAEEIVYARRTRLVQN